MQGNVPLTSLDRGKCSRVIMICIYLLYHFINCTNIQYIYVYIFFFIINSNQQTKSKRPADALWSIKQRVSLEVREGWNEERGW